MGVESDSKDDKNVMYRTFVTIKKQSSNCNVDILIVINTVRECYSVLYDTLRTVIGDGVGVSNN